MASNRKLLLAIGFEQWLRGSLSRVLPSIKCERLFPGSKGQQFVGSPLERVIAAYAFELLLRRITNALGQWGSQLDHLRCFFHANNFITPPSQYIPLLGKVENAGFWGECVDAGRIISFNTCKNEWGRNSAKNLTIGSEKTPQIAPQRLNATNRAPNHRGIPSSKKPSASKSPKRNAGPAGKKCANYQTPPPSNKDWSARLSTDYGCATLARVARYRYTKNWPVSVCWNFWRWSRLSTRSWWVHTWASDVAHSR